MSFLHSRLKINRKFIPVPALAGIVFSAFLVYGFLQYVDLKPKVDPNFFFSSEDPEYKADKNISETLPQPPFVIFAAKGDLYSPEYMKKLEALTNALRSKPEVVGVQSLTHGPRNLKDAGKSPLWRRLLLTPDGGASLIPVFLKDLPLEEMIPMLEKVQAEHQSLGFEVMISGAPYITELIQRKLMIDFKNFSGVCFLTFGLMIFFLFRSLRILAGVVLTCMSASMITLMINQSLNMKVGLLTANLSTMVFVITLSTIVFFTFNWKLLHEQSRSHTNRMRQQTIHLTFVASFWSIFTTFLGFLSLYFVEAEPMRQLGISGSIGTAIALIAGYTLYPWFLSRDDDSTENDLAFSDEEEKTGNEKAAGAKAEAQASNVKAVHPLLRQKISEHALRNRFGWPVFLITCIAVAAGFGVKNLSTDPSLLSYFRKGGEIRNGLEYIDHNGGSSLLNIVVKSPDGAKLQSRKMIKRLMKVQEALEKGPAVGSVMSIPVVIAEANRNFVAKLLPRKWLLNILEKPQYGEVTKFFITEDRRQALFIMRMNEHETGFPRLENVKHLEDIIRQHGLIPELTGGIYVLQGKLAILLRSSLVSGLGLLVLIFSIIGYALSRSIQTTIALTVSLAFIPVTLLGILGHFGIALDMISSPAANIAIGMGVDSMIHMLIRTRILLKEGVSRDEAWARARIQLWKPILGNMILVGAGFGIFGLSNFPPTQRFGFSVLLGSMLSPLASLLILPWLAGFKLPQADLYEHEQEAGAH